MGNPADIHCHTCHIIGTEQLPGRILIYNAVILHQVISREIGTIQQLHRMKQEKITAYADGIRSHISFVRRNRHTAVSTIGIGPQSCPRIHRLLNHRSIRKRTVHRMLEINDLILGNTRPNGEKTTDLRGIFFAAPSGSRRLCRLALPQITCSEKQDQENQEGNPSANTQYYFLHQLPRFRSIRYSRSA